MSLNDLRKYISFVSISTVAEYKDEIKKTASWLRDYFEDLGFDSRIIETDGNPVVYAENEQKKSKKTILVYGHYDVQPVEPLEDWKVDPFAGEIKDGVIWGRGSSDNKGQFWSHILAIKEYQEKSKEIPVNLKFVIEGEEEVGSMSMEGLVRENKEVLESDVVWITDGVAYESKNPTIELGLRGAMSFKVEIEGPGTDLHSGTYGGSVANPIEVLSKVIAGLWDKDGRVNVEGFYDEVKEPTEKEKQVLENEPLDEVSFLKKTGSEKLVGEKGYSLKERVSLRPVIEVTGIDGGYAKEGFKNIIPAKAQAKINVRTVAGQDWKEIKSKIKSYFSRNIPESVRWSIEFEQGVNAFLVDPEIEVINVAKKALKRAFKEEVVERYGGATLPVCGLFAEEISKNVVLTGWGEEMHVPNEKLSLKLLNSGKIAVSEFWEEFAK